MLQKFLKRLIIITTLLVVLAVSQAQTVQRLDDFSMTAIDNAVTAEMSQSSLPGVSIGIIYNGRIAYTKGYGSSGPGNVTTSTKFPIASVSKTITGILAMRMVQDGNLGLDSTIDNYLPPPTYQNTTITIRHLLSHQSGIGHYPNCPDGYDGPFDATRSMGVVLGCARCMTPPGSGTIYTTFGTTLLGVIVDRVGRAVYNHSYIGLYNLWIRDAANIPDLTAEQGSIAGMAWGYDEDGTENSGSFDDIGWKLPAGGFISTAHDLAGFGAGVINKTFINSATSNLMWTTQTTSGTNTNACSDGLSSNYGLAFRVSGSGKDLRINHNGLNDHGYSSLLYLYPNRKAGFVVLSNKYGKTGELDDIRQAIQNTILCPAKREFHSTISWGGNWVYEAAIIKADNSITSTTGSFVFDGSTEVVLSPGFSAPAGTNFRAISDGCDGSVNP